MVFQEHGVPAACFQSRFLARGKDGLEVRQRPVARLAPVDFINDIYVHMIEFEYHVKDPVRSDPFRQIFGQDSVRFADGENVITVTDCRFELMQIIKNAVQICCYRMDACKAVSRVRFSVGQTVRLFDV